VPAAQRIEDALWRAAERALPAAALSHRALVRAVMERTRRYTSERERLDEPLGPAEEAGDLAARALFFAVTDSAKVSVPLGELFGRGLLPAGDAPLRVLDLGAGAGAMTLGAAAFLADAGRPVDLQVTAIDRDRPALALLSAAAADLGAALGGRVAVEARHGSLRDLAPAPGSADLVLCGSVLNELDEATRLLVIERALAAAGERGAVVVIEPALRQTSRDLHRVRDRVIERRLGHVFAPCTRGAAPCPALQRERDWCHEDRPAALPARAAQIAAATGLRDGGMKFSYLVLRREPAGLVEPAAGRTALRLVSDPRKLKGRRACLACGDGGWVELRLLARRRSEMNRGFERARRGDVALVDGPAPERLRDLGQDEAVEIVSPAGRT